MKIPIYQVDAFSDRPFRGNPAAICPLESWLPDETLQAIAAENNLSETAYFVADGDAFQLRWFTPAVEVDLCGHATLASAHVLWMHLGQSSDKLNFDTKSGRLSVTREGPLMALDFPSRPPEPCEVDENLVPALGLQPLQVLGARDYLVVYATEDEVRGLRPEMSRLAQIDRFATIVTAPGEDCDFVSRFFAPAKGVPEDPVTGSAHTTLIPYWSRRLKKAKLHARQISARGGELFCEDRGERVSIAGKAVTFLVGAIEV
ncbi:MAG: PhzF family phenazine biosynthesis protein [Acidobacteria bacterium]|nr:PhzF family phenazine biosynthesis protein [Acidobacteriota bacterium]